MRLFIAIDTSEQVKNQIADFIDEIKPGFSKGRFIKKDNLHITLVFIGECKRADEIIVVLKEISFEPFCIVAKNVRAFSKRGGLYHIEMQKDERLLRLQSEIHTKLCAAGFNLEEREYYPHITIAREAQLFSSIDDKVGDFLKTGLEIKAESVTLFESKFEHGGVKYVPVYVKGAQK